MTSVVLWCHHRGECCCWRWLTTWGYALWHETWRSCQRVTLRHHFTVFLILKGVELDAPTLRLSPPPWWHLLMRFQLYMCKHISASLNVCVFAANQCFVLVPEAAELIWWLQHPRKNKALFSSNYWGYCLFIWQWHAADLFTQYLSLLTCLLYPSIMLKNSLFDLWAFFLPLAEAQINKWVFAFQLYQPIIRTTKTTASVPIGAIIPMT